MSAVPWTYDRRPDTQTTNVRVGIWLFLASETMFFGSLFSGYALLRTGADSWPDGRTLLELRPALINTALLAISWAMLLAPAAPARARIRLFLSAAVAALFLVGKYLDY